MNHRDQEELIFYRRGEQMNQSFKSNNQKLTFTYAVDQIS